MYNDKVSSCFAFAGFHMAFCRLISHEILLWVLVVFGVCVGFFPVIPSEALGVFFGLNNTESSIDFVIFMLASPPAFFIDI